MKISKSIQRRTIILVVATTLFALFQVVHLGTQLFYSTNPYADNYNHTFIGEMDTWYSPTNIDENSDKHSIVIERDAEGKPLVEALPSQVVVFSKNPNYSRPDHYGWKVNSAIIYIGLAMFVLIVFLMGRIFVSAIGGFRTGNIFREEQPKLMRWLALAVFIYYALINNREVFRQIAVQDIYYDASPVELHGAATISIECLIAPLLLLIFAELMAIASRFNEEESMTI